MVKPAVEVSWNAFELNT